MKITVVRYSALIDLGNYNNERIGFSAQIEAGETPESVVEALRQKTFETAGKNGDKLRTQIWEAEAELNNLNRKLQKATEQWNATAEFLRTQGLKPDAPNLPQFVNLLPEVQNETVEVEMEEEQDDEYEDDHDPC